MNYPGNVHMLTDSMNMANIVFNSTIYTPGANFMCCDIKNFYLGTLMSLYELIKIPIDINIK